MPHDFNSRNPGMAKTALPAAAEWVERLALKSTGPKSWCGPCPSCGGEDRFHVEDRKGRAVVGCRGCLDGQPMPARRRQFGHILKLAFGKRPGGSDVWTPPPKQDAYTNKQDRVRAATVAAIWSATVAADATPGRVYLARRFAWPPAGHGPDLPSDCRWLPATAAPPKNESAGWYRLPRAAAGALVSAFRIRGGDLKAVSLEALDGDGYRLLKRWRKTLGEKSGAVFDAGGDGANLVLAEGEISALAARWLHGGRIIATGGTAGLQAWRPGPGERGPFTIAADNDGPGRVAAGHLADALRSDRYNCNVQPGAAGDPADDLAERLRERAAIMEYESGMSREAATVAAWRCVMDE